MHAPEPLACRIKDAARILGLSVRTVWQLAHDGEIPVVRVGTGRRRSLLFPIEGLRSWLLERSARNQADTEGGHNDH